MGVWLRLFILVIALIRNVSTFLKPSPLSHLQLLDTQDGAEYLCAASMHHQDHQPIFRSLEDFGMGLPRLSQGGLAPYSLIQMQIVFLHLSLPASCSKAPTLPIYRFIKVFYFLRHSLTNGLAHAGY